MNRLLIGDFEGPLDLLLHLIKQSKMDISEIKIVEITEKYIDFIKEMEEMNLDIASEYLVTAAELLEMKSRYLLPKPPKEETEEDKGGKAIKKMVEKAGEQVVFMKAVPNDRKVLSTIMQRMADGNVADLILTTGGAGCGPEDCTPEATMDVADRPVLGIPEAMRAYMMSLTKRSMLNRCAAGIKGETLIVNLPGKEGAVKAALVYLLPEIQLAVEVIKGEV